MQHSRAINIFERGVDCNNIAVDRDKLELTSMHDSGSGDGGKTWMMTANGRKSPQALRSSFRRPKTRNAKVSLFAGTRTWKCILIDDGRGGHGSC